MCVRVCVCIAGRRGDGFKFVAFYFVAIFLLPAIKSDGEAGKKIKIRIKQDQACVVLLADDLHYH